MVYFSTSAGDLQGKAESLPELPGRLSAVGVESCLLYVYTDKLPSGSLSYMADARNPAVFLP